MSVCVCVCVSLEGVGKPNAIVATAMSVVIIR